LLWNSVAEYVEGIHATPHVAVAGDMNSLFSSPNDPMFYSHHAFIDKIWHDWQRSAGNLRKFGGVHGGRAATLQKRLGPWNRSVRQILDELEPCVSYAGSGPASRIFVQSSSLVVVQEASSVAEPAKVRDMETKREAQLRVAKNKVRDPKEYRKEVEESAAALRAMKRAQAILGVPDAVIQRSEETFKVIELKLGVDLKDLPTLNASSDAEIVAQGKKEVAAIGAGRAPPGKTDDSDVKGM
jgi:Common central domain of tyrosinase